MSKVAFTFTDQDGFTGTLIEVSTNHEHLEGVVEGFKTFLIHMGHHPDNVERVVLQGPEKRQGLPMQMELFPEDETHS